MSVADFKNNKLSYETSCKNSIHTHDFFWSKPDIIIKSGDKKYRLQKNSIYGYRNCRDEAYRFYNNAAYHIVEAGCIFIYMSTQNIAQSKGYKVVNNWYFSNAADGKIHRLTLSELKKEYKDNDEFIALLSQYASEELLSAYDDEHKTFKINYLYSKTTKK